MQDSLNKYGEYLPNARVIEDDMQKAQTQIKVDLEERLRNLIVKVDHKFAMNNY